MPLEWIRSAAEPGCALAARLGGTELGYQRGTIQEESLHYEHLKHTGEYPIIGVSTFRNSNGDHVPEHVELQRWTDEEKQSQLKRLEDFQKRNATLKQRASQLRVVTERAS